MPVALPFPVDAPRRRNGGSTVRRNAIRDGRPVVPLDDWTYDGIGPLACLQVTSPTRATRPDAALSRRR